MSLSFYAIKLTLPSLHTLTIESENDRTKLKAPFQLRPSRPLSARERHLDSLLLAIYLAKLRRAELT